MTQLYQVIYADPPWWYRNKKTGGSMKSGAASKYPTMTTTEICKLNIPAAKNAVLFLWATVPMLPDAFKVMEAWGYKYKTMLTWRKTGRKGLGYWFRGATEHLLFGIKGKIGAFRMIDDNIIEASVGQHSTKPEEFRQLIERATPHLQAKLGLFARKESPGWDVFGNEVSNSITL